MLWGPSERSGPPIREPRITAIPKLGFVFILVGLGIYTPKSVSDLLQLVAQSIGGN